MCTKFASAILFACVLLPIISGCLTVRFESDTSTENNVDIKFETPTPAGLNITPSSPTQVTTPTYTDQPTATLYRSPTVVPSFTANLLYDLFPYTRRVTVFSKQEWNDTGIIVSPSSTVSVKYLAGQWSIKDSQERYMDASGISQTSSDAPLPSSNLGSLIGRIGTGEPFAIGSEKVFIPSDSGDLYLQINDWILNDNDGEVLVEITVSSEINISQSTPVPSKDGMIMMYIPAGSFAMGSYSGSLDQVPMHDVYISSFWIDQTEVTNAQYALCVQDRVCQLPKSTSSNTRDRYYGNPEFDEYPVIFVTWHDAVSYCKWAGRRLPTEAEWEKAARSPNARTYPWGETLPHGQLASFNNNVSDTSPVGNFPSGASPYRVLDMAGNVEEWVADWFSEKYYANSPEKNPLGPSNGTSRILRGGSWFDSEFYITTTYRNSFRPDASNNRTGFRCVFSDSLSH